MPIAKWRTYMVTAGAGYALNVVSNWTSGPIRDRLSGTMLWMWDARTYLIFLSLIIGWIVLGYWERRTARRDGNARASAVEPDAAAAAIPVSAETPRGPDPMELASVFNQPVIQDRHLYLFDICRWLGWDEIHDKTFIRCVIEGPAVVNGNDIVWINPLFEADRGIEQVLYSIANTDRINGAIGMSHVRFVDCRFPGVAFLVHPDRVAELRERFGDLRGLARRHPLQNIGGVPPLLPPYQMGPTANDRSSDAHTSADQP